MGMEITVLSAQGLNSSSAGPFSHRLRPFISIIVCPPIPCDDGKNSHVYTTRIDDQGGVNPTWGDKFQLPIDTAFFLANRFSCIYLQLYTKRLIKGKVLLGWCQIPVIDIGFLPGNSVRHLSYRVRNRDGTRGHGIVNLAVKLTGFEQVSSKQKLSNPTIADHQEASDDRQTVIGVPVTVLPRVNYYQRHI